MTRIFILLFFLLFLHTLFSQSPIRPEPKIDTGQAVTGILQDSVLYKINDSLIKESLEQNNRNLDAFMAMQKEREAKEKKRMYIRIGLGIFFLAVLVFGLIRKNRKAKK